MAQGQTRCIRLFVIYYNMLYYTMLDKFIEQYILYLIL